MQQRMQHWQLMIPSRNSKHNTQKNLQAAPLAFIISLCLLFSSLYSPSAPAKVSVKEALRLKQDLTPLGAERYANKSGSIPKWETDEMTWSAHENWINNIQKEQPLYQINATNYREYQDQLSRGQIELLKAYPESFYIPVYPTHRTAKIPDWLYENAFKNALEAETVNNGEEIANTWPGLPFPTPGSAKEIMWNHQLRWKGISFNLKTMEATINRFGHYRIIENTVDVYSIFHDPNRNKVIDDWRYVYYLSYITAPAKLAGGAYLTHESIVPLSKPRQSWIYIAGQRRLRRSPVMGYDAPTFTSDGLRMIDEVDMFNGAMDRYDWKLLGKKEVIIPYNNEKLQKAFHDRPSLFTPYHLNPEHTRFEKHRVWMVEATLKEGKKHLYQKRVFYIDEDTWSIAMVDIFRKNDDFWRTSLRYSVYYDQMPGILSTADVYYDIGEKMYYVQGLRLEDATFSTTPPPVSYFMPGNIRQRLIR